MNPIIAVKDFLEAKGVGRFDPTYGGWVLNLSKEPISPDTTITIYNTGGLPPNPKYLLDYPSVQVRVRGRPNGYVESRATAERVKDVLLGIDSQDHGDDRWDSITMATDIVDLGYDQNNRPLHTLNFRCIVEPKLGDNRVPI